MTDNTHTSASSGGVAASTGGTATTKASSVSLTLDHPRLLETDPESIRVFLKKYDQYANEVISRARQLRTSSSGTEPVRPVDLKFCVDVEFLESSIVLEFITDASNYEDLTDEQVRAFLAARATESKEVVTLDMLDDIVKRELRTNMKNNNATARMQDLFSSYITILGRHGLKWIVTDNQKIAVQHVLSAIRPVSLKDRLESDLSFSHHPLKKDFKGFLKHSIRLAEAFQIVDSGPPTKRGGKDRGASKNNSRSGNKGNQDANKSETSNRKKSDNKPICLWPPHKERGLRHFLRECRDCPEEEKSRLLAERAKEKAKDGPSKSTRGQTVDRGDAAASSSSKPTAGRLQTSAIDFPNSPSCPIVVSDGTTSLNGTGRCDDGSDDSIASPTIAQDAVLKGIGRLEAITPVAIQVALTASDKPESFTFSRVWKVPRLVMELSAGRLALNNISFLVADANLSCEDVLVGHPVLKHLGIDSRTLLERNRASLDGTDCSTVDHPTVSSACGSLGRLCIARLQRTHGAEPVSTVSDSPPTLSSDRPRGNYYAHKFDIDPFPDPSLISLHDCSARTDDEKADITAMLAAAKANGFPDSHWPMLEALIWEFADSFSTRFSSTPAKVEPLRIELTADARPIRVKLRNYSASQRAFISSLMQDLVRHNLVYANPSSKWACAPLIVPKAGPSQWRFTVDLRPVNRFTVPYQFPMPRVEIELTKTAGSRFYANFDFTHGYWQLPLHPESQECQSFITPDNVYTPTRVLHGTTNAVLHLQSFLSMNLPDALKEHTLLWVDDCLFHEATIESLLDDIRQFLEFCVKFNWKLHPRKCVLFTKSVRWCGRIISADGIRHDPTKLDGLLRMDAPSTGAQLQQFLCAMQWLRSSIPNFQALVEKLHEFLETVYQHAGKRTKRAVSRVSLRNIGWSPSHDDAFNACKRAIANRATLAHRDETKRLCVFTDASDSYWSGVLTQVPRSELTFPHVDQSHEPLAFHSGRFTDTQVGWSTLEKEAFAVLATLERSHWLVSCSDGFDLYTDHNNLIFIFDPLAFIPDLGQAAMRKVLRWAVRLSAYNYVCFHIRGDENVWADLLTRWAAPSTIRRLVSIPPLPSTFRDFDWPSSEAINLSQEKHMDSLPDGFVYSNNHWRSNKDGPVWIPDTDTNLQLRLAIVAHTGAAGHRGAQATKDVLARFFVWSTLDEDITLFVKSCIHCLSTTGGETVPRPFGPALHGTMPNDLVQFDYIEMGTGRTGDKYILMVRDDHSGYCWFYPAVTTTAETAAHALLDWCAAFGAPAAFMSDGPTHFKNETIRLLTKGLRIPHHFTLPYCPWSNGAVERLGKELLRVARALLSELQFRHDEWPQLVPLFQSALNNAPSPQRKNVAPITAFTGRPSSPPIATMLRSSDSAPVTMSETQLERAMNVSTLVTAMDALHPVVDASLHVHRNRARNTRSKGQLANFSEGDYVLVAREQFFEGEKLCLRWRGPRRVVKALNDYVFKVEDLRNGDHEDIHGTRLKFYTDSSLDEKVILSHVLSSETGMPVSRLLKLVDHNGDLHVLVRWKGLSKDDDTLEPLFRVYEDVPHLLVKLLNRKGTPADLRNKAHRMLGL